MGANPRLGYDIEVGEDAFIYVQLILAACWRLVAEETDIVANAHVSVTGEGSGVDDINATSKKFKLWILPH